MRKETADAIAFCLQHLSMHRLAERIGISYSAVRKHAHNLAQPSDELGHLYRELAEALRSDSAE